jgi:hypothetical protein
MPVGWGFRYTEFGMSSNVKARVAVGRSQKAVEHAKLKPTVK